jgi:hypothetical protein
MALWSMQVVWAVHGLPQNSQLPGRRKEIPIPSLHAGPLCGVGDSGVDMRLHSGVGGSGRGVIGGVSVIARRSGGWALVQHTLILELHTI